jgi:hypothetical protein
MARESQNPCLAHRPVTRADIASYCCYPGLVLQASGTRSLMLGPALKSYRLDVPAGYHYYDTGYLTHIQYGGCLLSPCRDCAGDSIPRAVLTVGPSGAENPGQNAV